ncbi:AMP-binding protein (plasmid) [Pseudonocardia bannensis]|uniref:AMP-binding protein n=1 Tax=Pseudonocardia bannensis TaxID=630973 RepID=UPI001B7CF4C8|nr:AMP-binding protein [Pseudonocardia bannensis]
MGERVCSWIDYHAARTPERTALVDLATGRRFSYADLAGRVKALAYHLADARGIGPGDRVAALTRNSSNVFEIQYACALIGAIFVPLNWRLTVSEIVAVCRDARPAVLLHESAVAAAAAAVSAECGQFPCLRWASEAGEDDEYEAALGRPAPAGWAPTPPDEDDPWTIIYTSGTTGLPKGVVRTHRNERATILGTIAAGEVTASSVCLTVLPTFHVAGLDLFANPALFLGGTVLVMRTFEPRQALQLLTDPAAGVTHLCGVPANYQFMSQLPEFADAPLRPFFGAVGGSPVPAALLELWAGRGVDLTTVFGITEAGSTVITTAPGPGLKAPRGAVGIPVMHAEVRIVDADGVPQPAGRIGELCVRGPAVTPGYWQRPDLTAQAIDGDGWLATGDAAYRDEDGVVVLVDRWKDMYISGGENVYPAEVENALYQHPAVAQAAVIGVPHERWGETGAAFVVLDRERTATAEELTGWCRERVAAFKVPGVVHLVDELPRNATGKILKNALRALATGASS